MSVRPFYVPDITSSCKESMVACNCEIPALTLLTVSENKMKDNPVVRQERKILL